jgi:TatD DNase family protein
VGLDYTGHCKCRPPCGREEDCLARRMGWQHAYLERVLPILYEWDLTLVLHCRDKGDGSAARSVLELLQRLRLTLLRIHKHCFSGGREEVKSWLETCPHVYFGISSLVRTNKDLQAAVPEIPFDHIILESDAPYLPRYGTTPWTSFGLTLEVLCPLLRIPATVLLQRATSNSWRAYCLA